MDMLRILTVLIVFVLTILFFSRFLSKIFFGLFDSWMGGKKSQDEHDIDLMIERKKYQYSTAKEFQSESHQNKMKKKQSKAVEFYTKQIKLLKTDSPLYSEYKYILELFDNLKWGEGKAYNALAKKISKKHQIDIPQAKIHQLLKYLDQHNLLLDGPNHGLDLQRIENLFDSSIYYQTLYNELSSENQPLINRLEKKCEVPGKKLIMALEFFFAKMEGVKPKQLYHFIAKGKSLSKLLQHYHGHEYFDHYLPLVLDEKLTQDRTQFRQSLVQIHQQAAALTPFPKRPQTGQKELSWALAVLNLSSKDDKKSIKKKFHKLAKERHPDQLKQLGLGEELLPLIEENFKLLNDAYEIAKSS